MEDRISRCSLRALLRLYPLIRQTYPTTPCSSGPLHDTSVEAVLLLNFRADQQYREYQESAPEGLGTKAANRDSALNRLTL